MSEPVEITIIGYLVHLANGIITFMYCDNFLQRKSSRRKRILIQWTLIYTVVQIVATNLIDSWYPYNSFIKNVIPHIILIFTLQRLFFEKNSLKQIFVLLSFTAGWEILRFLISPLAHIIYNLWSPIYIWIVNDWLINLDIADRIIPIINALNRSVNAIVIFICRAIQIILLSIYLYAISKQFGRRDYELSFTESIFLIFPCVTILCIDLTIRLMAVSVDNGAIHLIYSRVPETTLLLPIVSLLLLGIVIASVTLFRNLIQFKDEEQKRMLLENRVIEVHREIEDLTNIYSDIRGLRHDLRNHISNIAAYVRQNSNSDDLNSYLNQMQQTVEKLDFFYKTGNPIVDIILHQTLQRARKKNIHFEVDFHCPKKFFIDIYDLSIILNNALQNALEAASKITRGRIYIRSYSKGNFYFIEVENDFDGKIELTDNLPATTKADKKLHGLGLTNIRRCAQKYNGDLDIEVKGQKFILTVMCQLTQM